MSARPRLPLLDVSLLLALISALLVTAGWAYAAAWYAQFDLGLRALEVPPVDFGIYGFKTLAAHWYWESVREALPRGSALLEVRAFLPRDFKTGQWGDPRWCALLMPADPGDGPALRIVDLGPTADSAPVLKRLLEGNADAAGPLYSRLFGTLDSSIAAYSTLFIAPDNVLDLVAFARLKLPDGRYWIQRQALREVRTGRDLLAPAPAHEAVGMLATHGFFLPAPKDAPTDPAAVAERPMTLGGVALAGANLGLKGKLGPDAQDGILYALEAEDLNLEGTELVALSACDTGKGEVDRSEGVYGLVRAFQIAGARDVLMTLWPLNDPLAQAFMDEFYRHWFDSRLHLTPAEAVRMTQLDWIGNPDERRRDPRYWAPYVLIERGTGQGGGPSNPGRRDTDPAPAPVPASATEKATTATGKAIGG